jgi:hypothetical protein
MTTTNEKRFTGEFVCGHCKNAAPMEIIFHCTHYEEAHEVEGGPPITFGEYYELDRCPACHRVILRKYQYCDDADPSDVSYQCLYPLSSDGPQGMPEKIKQAYLAAERVKQVDPNAYAVLIGRLLELICMERNAAGDTLNDKLNDLSKRNEIPIKLVEVATQLRKLRNFGAHASLGEITRTDVPILEDLTLAIVEYVYTAPHLAKVAGQRVKRLSARKKPRAPNKGLVRTGAPRTARQSAQP